MYNSVGGSENDDSNAEGYGTIRSGSPEEYTHRKASLSLHTHDDAKLCSWVQSRITKATREMG